MGWSLTKEGLRIQHRGVEQAASTLAFRAAPLSLPKSCWRTLKIGTQRPGRENPFDFLTACAYVARATKAEFSRASASQLHTRQLSQSSSRGRIRKFLHKVSGERRNL